MDKNKFRRKYRKQIDFFRPAISLLRRIIHPNQNEKRRHFGDENPGITIYIIRNSNSKAGMFSIITSIIEKTMYALDKGYYPIIDMMNYPNSYLSSEKLGKENAWSYFFCPLDQLDSITLSSAYNSNKVILSTLRASIEKYHFSPFICMQQESDMYKKIKKIYDNYICLNSSLENKFKEICNDLFDGKIVVGVLCRGTDYASLRPYAHPIQPKVEDVFAKVDEYISTFGCSHIYLCTEDDEIVNLFKKKYSSKLLLYPRKYVVSNGNEEITDIINKNIEPKEAGVDYLGQIYALSRCSYGVLSITSATPYICFMSKYKENYIFDLGKYGYDD